MSSFPSSSMCGPFDASASSTTTSLRCGCSRRTSPSSRFAAALQRACASQSFFFDPSVFAIGSGASGNTSRSSGCTSTAPSIMW